MIVRCLNKILLMFVVILTASFTSTGFAKKEIIPEWCFKHLAAPSNSVLGNVSEVCIARIEDESVDRYLILKTHDKNDKYIFLSKTKPNSVVEPYDDHYSGGAANIIKQGEPPAHDIFYVSLDTKSQPEPRMHVWAKINGKRYTIGWRDTYRAK